jgi:NitT/TauT family transport system substrate-binding protein
MVEQHLATANRSVDDIVMEDVIEPLELQAMKEGQIDAAFVGEPWLTRMLADGGVRVWARAEDLMPDSQVGSMWYGPTFLKENPDAGRRFMAAYLEGVRQYSEGPTPRNLEIVSQFTGLDTKELASICWSPVQSEGRINLDSVRRFREWLVKNGTLPGGERPVTDDELVDRSFVEWANAHRDE